MATFFKFPDKSAETSPLYQEAVVADFSLPSQNVPDPADRRRILYRVILGLTLGITGAGLLAAFPRHSHLLLAFATGCGAAWLGLRAAGESTRRASRTSGRKTTILLRQRTVETLELDLDEAGKALRSLQDNYREVARLARRQKTQIRLLQAGEQFFEAGAAAGEAEDRSGTARLLRNLMEAMNAGGGVLWLREGKDSALTPQAAEGRILPLSHFAPIANLDSLTTTELREQCERILREAAPAVSSTAPTSEIALPDDDEDAGATKLFTPQPALVVLLRVPGEDEKTGAILGAVGLCDPRGSRRFSPGDMERFHTLCRAFAVALHNLQGRLALSRRVHEISLLYDLSRLTESAADMEQVYKVVVAQAQKMVPSENCTLFLLDKKQNALQAKASRGRVVNLLEHLSFEKGEGVSGWVAARGKQIVINDLERETNLRQSEKIPARVRSFVATPLRVQNSIIGVLSVSHSEAGRFSADDLQWLSILAGQAAVTIERSAEYHTLETLAITDGLTRVYNHRYFQMRMEDELRRCKRYKQPLTVLVMDADHFKAINDRYGHSSGDAVLRDLGTLLRESVRDTEIVARMGGEEFALLLPQTEVQQAQIAAERIRASIEAHPFRAVDGQPIRVTVSIGLAGYPPHGATRADLLERADRALYAAKNGGRNQVSVATPLNPTLPGLGD